MRLKLRANNLIVLICRILTEIYVNDGFQLFFYLLLSFILLNEIHAPICLLESCSCLSANSCFFFTKFKFFKSINCLCVASFSVLGKLINILLDLNFPL